MDNHRLRTLGDRTLTPETLVMGYGYSPRLSEGALKSPLFQTSTFVFENAQAGKDFFDLAYGRRERGQDEQPGLIYSRINNPNLEVLEDRLAILDGAEKSLTFGSGMAAISTVMWSLLRPGDVVLHSDPIYGGSEYLFRNVLPAFGIKHVSMGDMSAEAIATALATARDLGRIAAIYIETPANPTNRLIDIGACVWMADSIGARDGHRPAVVVDNTFLGPLFQRPLELGADVVIHSLTKYVGGHSDLIAGNCSGSAAMLAGIAGMRTILGTMPDPHTCWLLLRSLETLHVRMRASNAGARQVAEFLRAHPKVRHVHYLGFLEPGTPDHELFQRQCTAPGSTFSFDIVGGEAEAFRVLDNLKIIRLAVSLGGTETLAEHPGSMTHSEIPVADRERFGITDSLLRISVGIETPEDLIADLAQALDTI